VVIAIIAVLAALFMPTLNQAKHRAYMVKCVSNLRQIGIGLKTYVDDSADTFPPAWSDQYAMESGQTPPAGDAIHHSYWLGGIDAPSGGLFAKDRLLAPYVQAREVFRCPADRNFVVLNQDGTILANTCFTFFGCDYRFNDLFTQQSYFGVADSWPYNLGLKKESWAPDPVRFITMHEVASYPEPSPASDETLRVYQWHNGSGAQRDLFWRTPGPNKPPNGWPDPSLKFVAPVLFIDSHVQRCDFSTVIRRDPFHALEPTKDWMWYKPLK
jgi:type II secretory pathway pseudopilin PulG